MLNSRNKLYRLCIDLGDGDKDRLPSVLLVELFVESKHDGGRGGSKRCDEA